LQSRTQDRATDQEQVRTQAQTQTQQHQGIYGGNLMTEQERNQYREQLRNMSTEQEKNAYMEQHRRQMQQRSKERGIPAEVESD
ncbi:MAG TPA: hypothetical protein VLT59_10885, partial [Steroidobacteraceae bacterium]|nr:hypothetical protein [Steroidobacteraceae bacterium]